jgi:hypothetical protein
MEHAMKSAVYLCVCLLAFSATFAVAAASDEWTLTTPSREDADQLETAPAYGYLNADGSLALNLDTAGLFAPELGLMVVNPLHKDDVADILGAFETSEGHWVVPDPETGDQVEVTVQLAAYNFDDGSETAARIIDDGLETLAVVSADSVALVHWRTFRYYRIRNHHRCGDLLSQPWLGWPPGACRNGYRYTLINPGHFLACAYQPNEYCLEWYRPVVLLTHYYCRDCSGMITWQRIYGRMICAEF